MSTTDRASFRPSALTFAITCCAAILSFTVTPVASTQSRIVASQSPANSNNTPKRQPVATLRASDSADGSRVALTADQSLNDYEAYRRGDRFYVRIPAAEVPRPEAVRGRAFGDVKVQRSATDTVVSFRLQPGATARVEQRGNKLDVVFTMPGARSGGSTSTGSDVARNDAGPAPRSDSQRRGNTIGGSARGGPASIGIRNPNDRTGSALVRPTPTPPPTVSPKPSPTPSAKSSPSTTASVSPRLSPTVAQQRSSSPPTSTVSSTQTTAQGLTWSSVKQRARYWILLAQLNPVPVGIGVAVLLVLIVLFILQRRRAKATRRRARYRHSRQTPKVAPEARSSSITSESETVESAPVQVATGAASAAVAAVVAEAPQSKEPPPTDAQHERVTRANEEVKKLMAGGDYDQSIIASEDRYTRQLVGAELLSALVGRNLQRRERARAAFMNHGYFDDATRDLRIGESPSERAAAARRLSFVHDREATPHLIAGLEDSSPDVRRAAVEALMDLRDPAGIAPLKSLMKTETDRRVPRSLIKQAIEACATSGADEPARPTAQRYVAEAAAAPILGTAESEREVIEI